ncbi:MAG: L-iditol 2-dehydrogenase [Candidatus Atribacteria bacterium]|nr:L-iditol 2-dehydrogenase [Candidatus Atribacteria bacterium]
MKAAVFSYPPGVEIKEVDPPKIGRGEVLVRVEAAALCGTDLRIARRGHGGIPEDSSRILGHEFVGIIEELGTEVADYQKGMRVAVAPNFGCGKCWYCIQGLTHHCLEGKSLGITMDGGFAELVRIPEKAVAQGNIFPLPSEIEPNKVAFGEAFACAFHGALPLKMGVNDSVLIFGVGPIGLMFLELSRLYGVREVWMADLSEKRLEMARSLGSKTILIGKEEIPENRFDVVVVAAPSPQAQQSALLAARLLGRINFFGGLPPQIKEVPLPSNLIHYKELTVVGTTKSNNFHFRSALELMLTGRVDLSHLVTHVLPLSEIEQGLKLMEKHEALKVVVRPDY